MPYTDSSLFSFSLLTLYLSLPLTFIPLLFRTAPYGKLSSSNWGPSLPSPLAWFLMESPTLLLSLLLLPLPFARHNSTSFSLLILSLFLLHYIHRTLLHPLRLRHSNNSKIPISIISMGFLFNVLNTYVQIRSAAHYVDYDGWVWTAGIWTCGRVGIGVGMFGWGMWVNVRADLALVKLKRDGGGGYRIPRGGWFELVSCPNYMGEMVEWLGWAVVAWSPAAFGFCLYTASNLLPRAWSYHKWYREKFGEDYPRSRKAVLPYIL